MTEQKQIEEMANVYYEAMLKARETLGSMNEGAPKWYAKHFYRAGYRKQQETAREIFEEIEECMSCFEDDDDGYLLKKKKKCEFEYSMRELKKKYMEDEK